MNVLLIGGTGVLSGAVTVEAQKRGIDVTMINRGNRLVPEGVELLKSDKKNYPFIEQLLDNRKFDAVIDFLCYTNIDIEKSIRFYSKYTEQYFFISSCAVYDKTRGGIKNEESPKPNAIWDYSVNKYKSEELLKEIASDVRCNYTIVRPCVTYDNTRIPYGIMPPYGYHWTLCSRILSGKPVIRWNGGVNLSNMMRVEDFAVGLIGLVGNPNAYNEDFNICGDEMPSFNDVLDALAKNLGEKPTVIDVSSDFYAKELPSKAGEILGGRSMDAINSNDKIKIVVPEFAQTISLEEGVRMTIDAYKKQNYQKGIDWRFDADTDRIIKKWCKKNRIEYKQYNLKFVDYLGNSTFLDRIQYYLEFSKDCMIVKMIRLTIKILNRLKR